MIYRGRKIGFGPHIHWRDIQVRKDDQSELDPRFDLAKHSTDGFDWGFAGSGPTQLALALLADVFKDEDDDELLVMGFYKEFNSQVIEGWGDTWMITSDEVIEWHQGEIESRRRKLPKVSGRTGKLT